MPIPSQHTNVSIYLQMILIFQRLSHIPSHNGKTTKVSIIQIRIPCQHATVDVFLQMIFRFQRHNHQSSHNEKNTKYQ